MARGRVSSADRQGPLAALEVPRSDDGYGFDRTRGDLCRDVGVWVEGYDELYCLFGSCYLLKFDDYNLLLYKAKLYK